MAAMGKGGYSDARTLLAGEAGEPPYDLRMLDLLMKAGLEMRGVTLHAQYGEKIEAITWAPNFVKKRLKSPSSADFSLLNTRYTMTQCGAWTISSYVEAQNAYGVMVRTPYRASVTKVSKDAWKLNDLQMGQ